MKNIQAMLASALFYLFTMSVQAQEQLNMPDSMAWGNWMLVQEDKRADNHYVKRFTLNAEPFIGAKDFLTVSAAPAETDAVRKSLNFHRTSEFAQCPAAKFNTSPLATEQGITTVYLQSFCDSRSRDNPHGVVIFRKLISTEKTLFTIARGWRVAQGQAIASSSTDLKEIAQIAKIRSETDDYMKTQIKVCAANSSGSDCAAVASVSIGAVARPASCESEEQRTAIGEIFLLANACEKKFPELTMLIPGIVDPAVKKFPTCFAYYRQSTEEKMRLQAIAELAGQTQLDRNRCTADLNGIVQKVITNVQ
jgi:dUTPase